MALSLLPTLVVGMFFSPAFGWKDCSISPQDEWSEATEPTPARKMRDEYERRYTCNTNEEGMM